ncbi:putative pyruvate, phosphate dikinase regulatory protein [uncultured Desulfobacterium sp.]|uniref:Putative pyruvate, phosphate dikinase regulatory protein n=1 Tax=uncultured Desulfobacterium sp. TaxID=201089 RepID=A0A445N1N3_9BACT|nr:putative pyruvate, phosphate dikinase regulatory protein [uncultured Desulfobacterium sp.]
MNHVFVISDGTGRTAQQALDAALTQFPDTSVEVHLFPEIRTEEQVISIIEQASRFRGFVVHTVVSQDLRAVVRRTGRLHNVETIDLMGPLLAQLSHQLSDLPSEKPGLFYELNKEYFRRIEATEFALRHDDGKRVEQLRDAEIVLLGVSRTFKTPLSIFLAFKGWFVANVPIVLGVEPPSEVFKLSSGRVFCLMTEPEPLMRLRKVRIELWRGTDSEYAKPEHVHKELLYARKIFESRPEWPVINVTNKPIEEIASEILSIMRVKEKFISRLY